jgi:hypothetical protein
MSNCTSCQSSSSCNGCNQENIVVLTKIIDDCICGLVKTATEAYASALKTGMVTPQQFESFYENINKYASVQHDPNSGTYTFGITSNPTLFVALNTSNVSCNGGTTGLASATVTGGISPYTLDWTDLFDVVVDPSALSAGAYKLVVTDAGGNTKTITFNITEPTAISATTSVTHETGLDLDNGTATVTATGGTGDYTYLWSDAQTTQTATGLAPGTYSVTITDENGCTLLVENITINEF